jgi:hypothetical protein
LQRMSCALTSVCLPFSSSRGNMLFRNKEQS